MHSATLTGIGQIDSEHRAIRIDALLTGKSPPGVLPGLQGLPLFHKHRDRHVAVLRQGGADIGVNADHFSVHIKERSTRVASHHCTVRGDELPIAQDPPKAHRRGAHDIEAPRMPQGHTPFVAQQISALPHLGMRIITLLRDLHHRGITVIIAPKLLGLFARAIRENDDDIIGKRGHNVSSGQDQPLATHDHSASRSAPSLRDQRNRSLRTRLGNGHQLLAQLAKILEAAHERSLLHLLGQRRCRDACKEQARGRDGDELLPRRDHGVISWGMGSLGQATASDCSVEKRERLQSPSFVRGISIPTPRLHFFPGAPDAYPSMILRE